MDWGAQPPSHFEVLFSNSSLPPFSSSQSDDDENVRSVVSGDVDISSPWDPITAYEIKTYVGNQTNVTLQESVWSGRYAHWGIRGNQVSKNETSGGTVAEWNLICEGA